MSNAEHRRIRRLSRRIERFLNTDLELVSAVCRRGIVGPRVLIQFLNGQRGLPEAQCQRIVDALEQLASRRRSRRAA
jgi:hypothetical protein